MELIIFDEDEKHLQINDFCAETPEDCRAFWRELRDKYAGYDVDFCYHNCDVPIDFMEEIGAVMLESCVEMRVAQENFSPVFGDEMTPVTDENFAVFAAVHDKTNPGMYWTSERIARDLDRWRIYTREDSYVMISLWDDIAEIFALEAADSEEGAALLSAAAEFAFGAGKTGVLFMVDDGAEIQCEAARIVGFAACGRYTAYRGVVE